MKGFNELRLMLFYRLIKSLDIVFVGGHWFYKKSINEKSYVIDAGANMGNFSTALLQKFGCFCYAIEPVKQYLKMIPNHKGIIKIEGALSGTNGLIDFYISDQLEASSLYNSIPTRSGKSVTKVQAQSYTWNEFIRSFKIKNVDLLKLDIEGAEIDLISSMTDDEISLIPQIIIEFHDFVFPEQVPEIRKTVARLQSLGFIELTGSRNYLMDMIFLNSKKIQFSYFWKMRYKCYKVIQFRNNHLYKDNY